MPYRDLRDYLDALEAAGELKKINIEVDWNLEIGAIGRRVLDIGAPAPLFQKIKGYPGFRMVTALPGFSARHQWARLALALDMPVDSNWKELTEKYLKGRKQNLIPPKIVEKGPCQENIYTGDKVDLFSLPAPMIHQGDGGRYLGTWHAVITKDPETGWVNYGCYRGMLLDKNRITIPNADFEHMHIHSDKYLARNEKMPFAITIGLEPILQLTTIAIIPVGISEIDAAGGIRGEPIEVVKCQTVDLHVPAAAEIVLEGYLDPVERAPEGPFVEHCGYMAGDKRNYGVGHVTAITYRNNPILTMSSIGVPIDENVITNFTGGAELIDELRDKRGLPIGFIYLPPEGCHHFAIVSTDVPYRDYPYDLAMIIWGTKWGIAYFNYLMVTNKDIDVTDMKQVIWAMITRANPARDILIIPRAWTLTAVPWSALGEHPGSGSRMLINATWPVDVAREKLPQIGSFEGSWPKEIQEKVLSRWKEYGL